MDIKQTPPPNQHPELRRATVHHVTNPALKTAYERKKEVLAARLGGATNVNERFVFHGTSLANAKAITADNFCLSKVGSSTDKGWYGRGFYFSANFYTGAAYAGGSGGAVLLCKVLVGKSHDMQGQRQDGCPRQPNFDSHISHSTCGLDAQEIVLLEPEQVLPVYRMAFSA